MKSVNCPQEAAITRAVRAGNIDESLPSHAATCAICREVFQAASWMQGLARTSESNPTLPDAGRVWWKAQLAEKQLKAEKAQDFSEWVEIISATVVSLGLAGWLAWNWFAIQGLMAWVLKSTESWLTAYAITNVFLPVVAVLSLIALALGSPVVDE